MNKQFKRILLLYKRSAYNIYSIDKGGLSLKKNDPQIARELQYFKKIHDEHYKNLHEVIKIFLENGVRFDEAFRGKKINYKNYDLIVTVGGDGTFLEASHYVADQAIFGINSVTYHSVGNFCLTDVSGLRAVVEKINRGKYRFEHLQRIRLNFEGEKIAYDALNDVLICHQNPAFLCRYSLKIGKNTEVQRSSGVWIATPAGSTGAIRSAGGSVVNRDKKVFQYKPRELYQGLFPPYQLKGGVLKSKQNIEVLSLMRQGFVYIDGAHHKIPFGYGHRVKIGISPQPLKAINIS